MENIYGIYRILLNNNNNNNPEHFENYVIKIVIKFLIY